MSADKEYRLAYRYLNDGVKLWFLVDSQGERTPECVSADVTVAFLNTVPELAYIPIG